MKIRIGNDICLRIKFVKRGLDNINIHSAKVYIINTTAEAKHIADLNNKTKFIGRFPMEPMIDGYTPTSYNINGAGYPLYRAFPQEYARSRYSGFGPNPRWNHIYKPIAQRNWFEYIAPITATKDRDTISALFPAEAQLLTGEYRVVVVAKMYAPGFSPNNLRTVTADYENVFTLVDSSKEGADGPVTIDVTPDGQYGGFVGDIYAESGSLSDDAGALNIVLNNGDSFGIDVSSLTQWYEGD